MSGQSISPCVCVCVCVHARARIHAFMCVSLCVKLTQSASRTHAIYVTSSVNMTPYYMNHPQDPPGTKVLWLDKSAPIIANKIYGINTFNTLDVASSCDQSKKRSKYESICVWGRGGGQNLKWGGLNKIGGHITGEEKNLCQLCPLRCTYFNLFESNPPHILVLHNYTLTLKSFFEKFCSDMHNLILV